MMKGQKMQAIATQEPSNQHEQTIKLIDEKALTIMDLSNALKAIDSLAYSNGNDEVASALHPIVNELYDQATNITDLTDKLEGELKR